MLNIEIEAKRPDELYNNNGSTVEYWGTPVLNCAIGARVKIELTMEGETGPQLISNSIASYNAVGERVYKVSGEWESQPAKPGAPHFLCPSLVQHSLVGKFGETGEPFLVGNGIEIKATHADLYLTVNDSKGKFNNNHGHFEVTLITETNIYPYHYIVEGNKQWTKSANWVSGITLEISAIGHINVGSNIHFNADGEQLVSFTHEDGTWVTKPPKNGSGMVPTLANHALIGKFGEDGESFFIGSQATIQVPRSGSTHLYLSVNDGTNSFSNNIGHFAVNILAIT